jgi:Tfp pilus assembly protein PilO
MMSASDLIRRILTERRAVIVPLALIALANIGVYLLAVYPLRLKVASSERRAAAAHQTLASAQRDERAARARLSLTEQAQKDLDTFYREVLPSDLTAARRQTYEQLATLAHEHNLSIRTRSYGVDESYKGSLERLNIAMVLKGDYADMRDFVYDLENTPEFVAIENISVLSTAQVEEGLTLTLNLTTYYRSEHHGA